MSKVLLASSPMNREFSTEAGPAQSRPITPDYTDASEFPKIIGPLSSRSNEVQAVALEAAQNRTLTAAQEQIDAERNKLSKWSASIPSKISEIERIIARHKFLVERTAQLKARITLSDDKYGSDDFRSQQFDSDHTQIVDEAKQAHDQVHAQTKQASQLLREARGAVLSQERMCRARPQLNCNELSAAMNAFQGGVTQLANAAQREQEFYNEQHERF